MTIVGAHNEVVITVRNGEQPDVDRGIVPIVRLLNSCRSFTTQFSCEGGHQQDVGGMHGVFRADAPFVVFEASEADFLWLAERSICDDLKYVLVKVWWHNYRRWMYELHIRATADLAVAYQQLQEALS